MCELERSVSLRTFWLCVLPSPWTEVAGIQHVCTVLVRSGSADVAECFSYECVFALCCDNQ